MHNRILCFILLSLVASTTFAQRIIRRSSRHYVEAKSLPARVEPLLKDNWAQFAPNNNMCPLDSTGQRCVVGCVATAMSQVMNYWQWPLKGQGSFTYTDEEGCGQTLTADFSAHTYDWANMLNTYTEGAYTQKQADAVALLSSDCGIAVKSKYGPSATAARSVYQPLALANYFGYDRGIQMHYRDFYSLEEITLMLKKELAQGHPVLISGHNPNGGHAFVIDGYDENDWFHCCWGNPDKNDDAYTYLPNMVPNQPEWYHKDSPENGYNLIQSFVLGIMPENDAKATGIERHNYAFQYIKAVGENDATYSRNDVQLTVHDLCNIGWNEHTDSVVLMLRKGEENILPIYKYECDFPLEEIEDTTFSDTLRIGIPKNVENGTYTIVPMYRDNAENGGSEWREARTCCGTPNYLIATVKGESVALVSDTASTSYLTLEDIDVPDLMLNGQAPEYCITFRNHGPEMAGRVYLILEDCNGENSFYLQRQGITVGANETYILHNNITKLYAPKLGTYKLHVLYESTLFADELIELETPYEIFVTIGRANDIKIAFCPAPDFPYFKQAL